MDTQQTSRPNLLGDTSAPSSSPASSDSAGGCCGGGSCGCGAGAAGATEGTAASTDSGTYAPAATLAPTVTGVPEGVIGGISNAGGSSIGNGSAVSATTQEFFVTGMTCGHCVASVKEEVGAVDGISAVEVVLKKGGSSRVTVSSTSAVDEGAVRSAVEEAGYQLV